MSSGTELPVLSPPSVPLVRPDVLWLQVTGTLCNIACRHCFISCGPQSTDLEMMTRAQVEAALGTARRMGFREYYFTGGEPFLHPEIFELCEITLAQGPLSILTNGLLLDDVTCQRLRRLFDESEYSFDLRVSLDGMTASENDPVRGRGTFDGIVAGIRRLGEHGLSPVVTVVEHREGLGAAHAREAFIAFTRSLGVPHARVKFIPLLRIGREERRTRPYGPAERVTELLPGEHETLQCGTSRMVTAAGAWPCPILVLEQPARLGDRLEDALGSVPLQSQACYTCHAEGLQCRT